MRTAIILAVVFACCEPALAKYAPVDQQIVPRKPALSAIDSGPAGARAEQNYFQAPQPFAARRIFPCTVRAIVFEKTQLARACD